VSGLRFLNPHHARQTFEVGITGEQFGALLHGSGVDDGASAVASWCWRCRSAASNAVAVSSGVTWHFMV